MAMKRWTVGAPDREIARTMADECGIDAFAALVAYNRGISDASELELLICEEPILCEANELKDIEKAADCINEAISNGTLIAVYGDYDCDGVAATAILYDYLKSRNANVIYYIPDRISEGYGMNICAIDQLKKHGVGLIVTVDNGISCIEEIDYANSIGIKTVVTDHHLVPDDMPNALAVVDPHREDCPSTFKEICGAQVAFKLVCVLEDKQPEQMLYRYGDLVAIATIGDVMPLINENRSFVKSGIAQIKSKARVGVSAILNVAGVDRQSITAGRISFGIVPRINAAGRMGDASRAVELLLCEDMVKALKIANEIDADNQNRQQLEKSILNSAESIIKENGYMYNRVIVVAGSGWHCGVLGIVAARLTEKYGKPTIVLALEDGVYHGSGRSFKGFHLHNAIRACSDLLIKYGGHELAAGVSVSSDNLDAFRTAVNEYAYKSPAGYDSVNIDFKLNPKGMSVDMAFALKVLEPFGNGFEAPVFGIFGVKLEKITAIGGGKHLKLLFSKDGGAFQCLLFSVTPEKFCFDIGDTLDLAVTLDINFFRDEYNLSVVVKAIRPSGINEDTLFEQISAFDSFMSGKNQNTAYLLPDRLQVGEIYKYIKNSPALADKVKYAFINTLGYAKTMVSLITLSELGLIFLKDGVYYTANTAEKKELTESKTYKKLKEG